MNPDYQDLFLALRPETLLLAGALLALGLDLTVFRRRSAGERLRLALCVAAVAVRRGGPLRVPRGARAGIRRGPDSRQACGRHARRRPGAHAAYPGSGRGASVPAPAGGIRRGHPLRGDRAHPDGGRAAAAARLPRAGARQPLALCPRRIRPEAARVGRGGPEVFPVRRHGRGVPALRVQPGLRGHRLDRAPADRGADLPARRRPAAHGGARHGPRRVRLQGRRGPVSPVGARCLPGRARHLRGADRVRLEARRLHALRPAPVAGLPRRSGPRRVARGGRGLDPGRCGHVASRRCSSGTSRPWRSRTSAACSRTPRSPTPAPCCSA